MNNEDSFSLFKFFKFEFWEAVILECNCSAKVKWIVLCSVQKSMSQILFQNLHWQSNTNIIKGNNFTQNNTINM